MRRRFIIFYIFSLASMSTSIFISNGSFQQGQTGNSSDLNLNLTEFLDLNLTTLTSTGRKILFKVKGSPSYQGTKQTHEYDNEYDEDQGTSEMTECYCAVTVNGRSHSVEDAVCGRKRRIWCPDRVGCQKTTASISGYTTMVKACGTSELARPNCRPERRHHSSGSVDVSRCFCFGRLCNGAVATRGKNFCLETIIWSTLAVLFKISY